MRTVLPSAIERNLIDWNSGALPKDAFGLPEYELVALSSFAGAVTSKENVRRAL